ncbi:hypothetical protein COCMIDRAFT_1310 [Bipolaris oryzae ATCC 44560]|uniref:DUF1772 domain-containing protein n=1 Tax=Bipolaris oryzae ATCC 44560 TaxID=930090 RepID=W7A1J0_COCMI|nr:uncharacterized protein COCMIDRAFT_1310 [Bipolaris oryzae ATCC 44560]EUC49896.1 hypothetical protein COCMIDRAFT_1310 [Bipolaris oryzae ATCC 44560]
MLSFTTLQVGTLVQATFLLGMNTALSSISIPSVLISPSPILAIRQWHTQFRRAQVPATTLSASNLVLSLILAYGSSSSGFANKTTMLYVASSVMAFLIFPFTLHYMNPINDALIEKFREQEEFHYADLPEKDAGMQTAIYHDKIAYWGWLNRFRIVLYSGVVLVNAVAVLA